MLGTLLSWMAKRELRGPQAAFLKTADYDSLWNISFRWCNVSPDGGDPENVPDDVKEIAYQLNWAFFKGDLELYRRNGRRVLRETIAPFLNEKNPWRNVLWRCNSEGLFDHAYFNGLYLQRRALLSWCEKAGVTPPQFWTKTVSRDVPSRKLSLENRSKDELVDKLACQAIARVYWEIDPNIHPAHLANSKAIKLYGNGKFYTDENTVKNWIGEVDPRKTQRKTGRPEKIEYRIDLETGGLKE